MFMTFMRRNAVVMTVFRDIMNLLKRKRIHE